MEKKYKILEEGGALYAEGTVNDIILKEIKEILLWDSGNSRNLLDQIETLIGLREDDIEDIIEELDEYNLTYKEEE